MINDKEEIIELIEHHRFKLDLDRWDDKGWMRFVINTSEWGDIYIKPLIIWKDTIEDGYIHLHDNYPTGYLCRICMDYWFKFGQRVKQEEIKDVLGIE